LYIYCDGPKDSTQYSPVEASREVVMGWQRRLRLPDAFRLATRVVRALCFESCGDGSPWFQHAHSIRVGRSSSRVDADGSVGKRFAGSIVSYSGFERGHVQVSYRSGQFVGERGGSNGHVAGEGLPIHDSQLYARIL
jgi:hypothetical protein